MSSRMSIDPALLKSADAALFREAMSHVASPVHIVTTDGEAGLAGYTCTAFASVSDNPPTVLVCLNRSSSSAPAFRINGIFAVNTLRADEQEIADIFSGLDKRPLAARFEPAELWTKGTSGAPLLKPALASFECRVDDLRDIGSHQVMTGRVVNVEIGKRGRPLFYHARQYRTYGVEEG